MSRPWGRLGEELTCRKGHVPFLIFLFYSILLLFTAYHYISLPIITYHYISIFFLLFFCQPPTTWYRYDVQPWINTPTGLEATSLKPGASLPTGFFGRGVVRDQHDLSLGGPAATMYFNPIWMRRKHSLGIFSVGSSKDGRPCCSDSP